MKKINIKYGNRRSGDAVSLVSDINQLMKTITWIPRYNDLEIILKTSINWENKIQNELVFRMLQKH